MMGAQTSPPTKPKKPMTAYLFGWTSIFGKILPHKQRVPQAQPPQLVGEIKMVNHDDRFVLIDALSLQGTKPGDSLICISAKRETGYLRVSAFKSPPFLIGDIASGNPSVGDQVFKQ